MTSTGQVAEVPTGGEQTLQQALMMEFAARGEQMSGIDATDALYGVA
ncbi:hypothetical protein LCL87_20845 [Rhodococcus hoagii]|nr:hypothetical protein [Prescottella equi]